MYAAYSQNNPATILFFVLISYKFYYIYKMDQQNSNKKKPKYYKHNNWIIENLKNGLMFGGILLLIYLIYKLIEWI